MEYLFRSFVAVADARSFSGAAKALRFSQSTLSRQITRLEHTLGTRLFERCGRYVECTADGQLLLPLARAIVARTDEAVSLVREQVLTREQLKAGLSTLRLGATGNAFAHVLTPILASYLTTHGNVRVELIEKDDAALEEAVISGELDCALMTRWGSARTASRHVLTEEILLVVPRGHRLAGESTVTMSMLADEVILLPRPTMNVSNIVIEAFRRAGLEPRLSPYRVNYPELTKALVRVGVGVALEPKNLVAPETLEGLVAIPFARPLSRELHLIFPRDRPLSSAVRALLVQIQAGVSQQRAAY